MNWRGWLAFAGIGSAVALACRGDWAAAGEAAAAVLVPVVAWAGGQFAATRRMLRSLAEMSEASFALLVSTEPVCSQDEAMTCGYPVSDKLPD